MRKEKSVVILGGTFNPVHIGHLIIAQGVLNYLGECLCSFVVSADPPHKKDVYTEANIRYKMTELAVSDNELIDVSNLEMRRDGPSYTLLTLKELNNEYDAVYFIIGADNLMEIKTWYSYKDILEFCKMVVVPRIGYMKYFSILENAKAEMYYDDVKDEGLKYLLNNIEKVEVVDLPIIDISSTYIRGIVSQGKSIQYLVPDRVREYIRKNGLYD
jgi:nicotinate-nucleotide adenylyltransferase